MAKALSMDETRRQVDWASSDTYLVCCKWKINPMDLDAYGRSETMCHLIIKHTRRQFKTTELKTIFVGNDL